MIQTVSIDPNALFQPSEGSMFSKLKEALPISLEVEKVTRSFASAYYAVTINNHYNVEDKTLKAAFRQALDDNGYSTGQVISIEGGEQSSNVGGISQASEAIVDTVKTPLIAIAVVAVVILIFVYLPRRS
jgi:hypothetical protein